MICYVLLYQEDELVEKTGMEVKRRFEEISGEPCLVMHYLDMNPKVARDLRLTAIIYSGFGRPFATYDVKTFLPIADTFKEVNVAQMAFCGGHQLLAFAYNRDLRRVKRLYDEPMRRLRKGEPDWWPEYHPGYYKEKGIHPVKVVRRDPLFAGLGATPMLPQSHFAEVKRIPRGFVLLATSKPCRVQAMRHRTRPLYGTQFHPEKYTKEYPDGRTLLRNFFRLARTYARAIIDPPQVGAGSRTAPTPLRATGRQGPSGRRGRASTRRLACDSDLAQFAPQILPGHRPLAQQHGHRPRHIQHG